MVFVCSLSHGGYSGKSFQVPNNIQLITYTHPRLTLGVDNVFPILYQVLNRIGDDTFVIKPEILELENNTSTTNTYQIKSVPIIELTSINVPYSHDKRKIGDVYNPKGKFYVNYPCSESEDLKIEFNKNYTLQMLNEYSIPNTYMQTPQGSVVKDEIQNTRIQFSSWLNELSEIYKEMYPNKIISVLHLSCRWENEPYVSVDELSKDISNMSLSNAIYGRPDFRPQVHSYSRYEGNKKLYVEGVEGYSRTYDDSLILTKSRDVSVEVCENIQLTSNPIHISKHILMEREKEEERLANRARVRDRPVYEPLPSLSRKRMAGLSPEETRVQMEPTVERGGKSIFKSKMKKTKKKMNKKKVSRKRKKRKVSRKYKR